MAAGLHAHPHDVSRRYPDGVSPGIEAVVEVAHQVGEADGVDVEDGRGIGIRPHLGRIAGHQQDVPQPERRCAEQVAQHAEQVAVAAGVVRDRLDAEFLLEQDACQHRAHAALRARTVRDIDGVDPGVTQRPDVGEHARGVDAARRHDLDRGHERAACELRRPPGAIGKRHRLDACRAARGDCRRGGGPGRTGAHRRDLGRKWPDALDHRVDVLGRRAAASAHDLHPGLQQVARVRRHVLRARHVHRPSAHVARHAGVGERTQLAMRERDHPLDRLEHGLRPNGAVEAHHLGVERIEPARDILRRGAEGGASLCRERHLRDDGKVGVDGTCGGNGLRELIEVAEGLEHEAVDATVAQRLHLFGEPAARLGERGGAVWLQPHTEGPDRAGDEPLLPGGLRASTAAARLKSPTWDSSPCWASLGRLAPKVFVSSTSAPAATYASWMLRTSSGARTFSSS